MMLFDLPSMLIESKPYKYTVATISKVPYCAGNLASHALQGLKYSAVALTSGAYSEVMTTFAKDAWAPHQ